MPLLVFLHPPIAHYYGRRLFRWFREENEQLTALKLNERIFIVSGGLLKITKAKIEDTGKYLCWVNNTAGEETIQVSLTITGRWIMQVATVRTRAANGCSPPAPSSDD